MKAHAKSTFELKAWDEKPFNEMNGLPKLTRASVIKSYQGDITGEGKVEYLMIYRDDASASFVGLERVVGSVAGRSGSFAFQHTGLPPECPPVGAARSLQEVSAGPRLQHGHVPTLPVPLKPALRGVAPKEFNLADFETWRADVDFIVSQHIQGSCPWLGPFDPEFPGLAGRSEPGAERPASSIGDESGQPFTDHRVPRASATGCASSMGDQSGLDASHDAGCLPIDSAAMISSVAARRSERVAGAAATRSM